MYLGFVFVVGVDWFVYFFCYFEGMLDWLKMFVSELGKDCVCMMEYEWMVKVFEDVGGIIFFVFDVLCIFVEVCWLLEEYCVSVFV